jgi:hypothetical protein
MSWARSGVLEDLNDKRFYKVVILAKEILEVQVSFS